VNAPYLKDFAWPPPQDAGELKLVSDVREYGWHVLGVDPDSALAPPPFAYSVGLFYSLGHPEVIVTGLPQKSAQVVINAVGRRAGTAAPVECGLNYLDILHEFPVSFRPVSFSRYPTYVGYAMWFYRHIASAFPLLQLYWPDRGGRFPWDPGFEPSLAVQQFQVADAV
jgi:hypothetical protein